MQRRLVYRLVATFFASSLLAPSVLAGVWGAENWGEMYWGTNAVSAPSAPTITSIVADGTDLIVTLAGYPVGDGSDGWSVVTGYTVTCGAADPVESSSTSVRISGLDAETEYSCTISATNAQGDSPGTVRLATTEVDLQGLNIGILYQAICRSANAPASCNN